MGLISVSLRNAKFRCEIEKCEISITNPGSSAVQPPHALLLSRTRWSWPARVAGRLQCKGHMIWKPAAVSALRLAQRCRSSMLRVQQEVRSGALQPVNALPHGKARRIRSAHATDGLQFEGGSTLSPFYSRAVHTADKPRSPSQRQHDDCGAGLI